MVMTPWTRLSRPPASIATTTPSHGLPVDTAVEKPATAPISIIPSTPRLRTPLRSARISPIAANSEDRPARDARGQDRGQVHQAVASAAVEPDPVADEDVAADQAEQDDALDHRRDAGRLDLAAGQDERPEQDRRDDDPERAEPGEVGDDDRGEPVAGRDVVLEAVDDAADLAHARPARPAPRR